jgi:hypothetical protein
VVGVAVGGGAVGGEAVEGGAVIVVSDDAPPVAAADVATSPESDPDGDEASC